MTIKERRTAQLNRHYAALETLAKLCGLESPNGKKLSCKLLQIERIAHKRMEDYCNGIADTFQNNRHIEQHFTEVQKIFNNQLIGFFVNTDPRGYTLKIDDEIMRTTYKEVDLQRDWGGYGLLAPEINGK